MSNGTQRLLNPNPNPERVLKIPVKKTDPVELYRPLRNLVATRYSESDAQKVENVLETLNKCRKDIVERFGDLSFSMQRDCLIHYFKCLCMVDPLFTAVSSDAGSDPITFFWYDAFLPEHEDGVSSQRNSIQLEKADVLFNLGAVCSQIGASCDHNTALGRHLAMDAFNAAAKFFFKLWKDFAKGVSATLDLTLVFAEALHSLFSAQASELKLQQQLHDDNNYNNAVASPALQQHRIAVSFESIFKHYQRAGDLIFGDSAAIKHVCSFDETWIPHLRQKKKYFQVQAHQTRSSILPESQIPETFSLLQYYPLGHDAESVTEKLIGGICSHAVLWRAKREGIYLDLILSEYSPFKIMDGGKLVANPWDMPPPYPTNFAIRSSSFPSHILAFPLKKTEPLDLYGTLRNCFVFKYSESVAERVEGLLQMLNKLRSEMLRDDLSLPVRRDCLLHYFKCLCMIEPLFLMTDLPNPPIFVWYDAFNPQQKSSQHHIHFEKASVLFNLGALCTQIAISCDLTTIQGHRLAKDALNDASHWFFILPLEAKKVSATIDLSVNCARMLHDIISAQIADLEWNFPHSRPDRSSLPVTLLYQKAYALLTSGPENLVPSSIPQYLEEKMKTCAVETAPTDVTEQFLSGYCMAQSVIRKSCLPPCLDLHSEVGPIMIKDGNFVINLRGSIGRIGGDELPRDVSNMTIN
ncbi:uncharacterized protein LOC127739568 [Arachis duranensis]|uniref:Uncharacterized protein LOC127739568 n=1 Tax=Arachis duranensis TaxID=130453 RepID=A0A6P4CAT9_ARADU|nr:uncharacterized protein LOC127739568 [Arachis duranensis]